MFVQAAVKWGIKKHTDTVKKHRKFTSSSGYFNVRVFAQLESHDLTNVSGGVKKEGEPVWRSYKVVAQDRTTRKVTYQPMKAKSCTKQTLLIGLGILVMAE